MKSASVSSDLRSQMIAFRSGPLAWRLRAGQGVNAPSPSAVAKRDLALFYDLLYDALRTIDLSTDEAYILAQRNCDEHDRHPMPIDRDPVFLTHRPGYNREGTFRACLGGFNRGSSRSVLLSLADIRMDDDAELNSVLADIRERLKKKILSWNDLKAMAVEDALRQYSNLSDGRGVDFALLLELGLLHPGSGPLTPALVEALEPGDCRLTEPPPATLLRPSVPAWCPRPQDLGEFDPFDPEQWHPFLHASNLETALMSAAAEAGLPTQQVDEWLRDVEWQTPLRILEACPESWASVQAAALRELGREPANHRRAVFVTARLEPSARRRADGDSKSTPEG